MCWSSVWRARARGGELVMETPVVLRPGAQGSGCTSWPLTPSFCCRGCEVVAVRGSAAVVVRGSEEASNTRKVEGMRGWGDWGC